MLSQVGQVGSKWRVLVARHFAEVPVPRAVYCHQVTKVTKNSNSNSNSIKSARGVRAGCARDACAIRKSGPFRHFVTFPAISLVARVVADTTKWRAKLSRLSSAGVGA